MSHDTSHDITTSHVTRHCMMLPLSSPYFVGISQTGNGARENIRSKGLQQCNDLVIKITSSTQRDQAGKEFR